MKLRPVTATLFLLVLTSSEPVYALQAADLQALSFDDVAEQLGPPRSTLWHGDTLIANFAAAKVVFVNDTVSRVKLIPASVRETPTEQRQRIETAKEQIGPKLLQRYRASGEVRQLPLRAQQAFWLSFQNRFPELDVTRDLAPVTHRIEALELAELRKREAAQAAAATALLAKLAAESQQRQRRAYHRIFYRGYRPWHPTDRQREPKNEQCREDPKHERAPTDQGHSFPALASERRLLNRS